MEKQPQFSGCADCPVTHCDTSYRGSNCAAKRADAGADFDPLTHAEEIRRMEGPQLEGFIRSISNGGKPWCDHHCQESGSNNCDGCLSKWLGQSAALKKQV